MNAAKPFDEMHAADGTIRTHYQPYSEWLGHTPRELIARKRKEADLAFHRVGITFNVYGADGGKERLIPFDLLPRIIPGDEWRALEAGLRQRVRALNAFLADIYHDREILRAGRIPADQVLDNAQFRPEMQGVHVPGGLYAMIAGIDLVRAAAASVPSRPISTRKRRSSQFMWGVPV